jgi:Uma2 family endonuclease
MAEPAALRSDPDLLYEEAPVESQWHATIAWNDLVLPLREWGRRNNFPLFVGSDSPVMYKRGVYAIGPDVYVVNGGVDRGQEGWVPWHEGGLMPTLIIEMLSPSTETRDRVEKLEIYRDMFRTPDYFLFESSTGGVEYRRLRDGAYVRVHANRQGRFRCASLPLLLGVLDGRLRWFERNGTVLPSFNELADAMFAERDRAEAERDRAEAERDRAEAERARADAERARVERLLARLKEAGIDEVSGETG